MHPLPQSLPKECQKAEKIIRSFMEPSRNGLDGVIPRDVLAHAKGFCIFTVVKAGFVFSARAGSGIVIARLPDGSWSAPSAIGTAGMGFGGQAGAEMTEFLIVLNSNSALKTFMSAGSLTIGGNLSVAVGPLGRNGEVSGSLNSKGKMAAMYSYSKTKGLFGGVSIEGSVIVERQDANAIAYDMDKASAKLLLTGGVPAPPWASGLIEALKRATGFVEGWVEDPESRARSPDEYAFGGSSGVSSSPSRPKLEKKSRSRSSSLFGASADSVKKMNPFGSGTSKRNNPANAFLEAPRKSYENPDYDDDADDNAHTDSSPFGASKPEAPLSPSNNLFSESFSRMDLNSSKKTAPQFSTHFDSDFDPNRPPPLTQTHHRSSSSFSGPAAARASLESQPSTNWKDRYTSSEANPADDDPFGIYTAPPSQAPLPPNLAYNLALARQSSMSRHQKQASQSRSSYDRYTPPLTNSSSIHSSPTYQSFPSMGVSEGFSSNAQKYETNADITSPKPVKQLAVKRELTTPLEPGTVRAIALYDFAAQEAGDLGFRKGDVIMVTKMSDTADDWWTGRIDTPSRRQGIFPANFVELYNVDF
ncbi:DUF500-domain-containing protein [Clavulina sp. PMI_390]|nr:DUF500-domain-containing protein [Clavulina sp. PMI_390]